MFSLRSRNKTHNNSYQTLLKGRRKYDTLTFDSDAHYHLLNESNLLCGQHVMAKYAPQNTSKKST